MNGRKAVNQVLALALAMVIALGYAGFGAAKADQDDYWPTLTLESGSNCTVQQGTQVKISYIYYPSLLYYATESLQLRVYDNSTGTLVYSTAYDKITTSSGKRWNVQLDTSNYTPGIYRVHAFIQRGSNVFSQHDSYITVTERGSSAVTITLNEEEVEFYIPYISTKGKYTLEAAVTGADEDDVYWSSDNKTVASVSQSGVVTLKKKGTATITAEVDGKYASCVFTVRKQTAKAYYNENFKDYILNITELVHDYYDDEDDMQAAFMEIYTVSKKLKTAVNKVSSLKSDSQIKTYLTYLVNSANTARKETFMEDTWLAAGAVYQQRINNYLMNLTMRIRVLLR